MSIEQRAKILETATSSPLGVREIVERLKGKTSNITTLLEEMRNEGLVDLKRVESAKRGRPKKQVSCTSLGVDFLETYRTLKTKPLRARRQDLERAVKDARYAERLVANGHSPFELFKELNMIVDNIKVSSKTAETV